MTQGSILIWLFASLAALVAGYGIYWLTWRILVLIRPRHPPDRRCVVCGTQHDDLCRCDSCGRYVCRRHVITYGRGADQVLIKPDRQSADHYYRRERSLPQGHRCPFCDGKRLIGMLLGIIGGNLAFAFIMRQLIFR
jgi:hypothetical protein